MNKLFSAMSMMLADGNGYNPETGKFEGAYAWLNPLMQILTDILAPILIVLATAGVIYSIYLGVMMAKAEDQGKRDEAKKRIINVVIAIAITVVLIALFYGLRAALPSIIGYAENPSGTTTAIGL